MLVWYEQATPLKLITDTLISDAQTTSYNSQLLWVQISVENWTPRTWTQLTREELCCRVVSNDISHYQLNSVVPSFRYTRECVGCSMGRKGIRFIIHIFITIISRVKYADCNNDNRGNNIGILKRIYNYACVYSTENFVIKSVHTRFNLHCTMIMSEVADSVTLLILVITAWCGTWRDKRWFQKDQSS